MNAGNPPRAWTPQEDALLGNVPDESLARKLHRSVGAVRARRHEKRIAFKRGWTPQEEELLGTMPDAQVADLLDRAENGVAIRRRQLDIPPFLALTVEKKLANLTDQQIARLLRKSHRIRKTVTRKGRAAPQKWSPREDELLGKWPDKKLAQFLGRSAKAVQARRHKSGIFFAEPNRRWEDDEIRDLDPARIEGSRTTWTTHLARKLERTVVSVKGKRRQVYGPTIDARPWTKRELAMLGTRPDSEVAKAIGRKCGTVQVRRGQLRIKSFRERNKVQWTAKMDRLLGTRSDMDLAKHWGLSYAIVKERRQELGVSSQVSRPWTKEEEALIGTISDKEVATRIGRTKKSVFHRRIALGIYLRIKSTKAWKSSHEQPRIA